MAVNNEGGTGPWQTALGQMWQAPAPLRDTLPPRSDANDSDKRLPDLAAAFDAMQIKDGATLSFHHHYRNGDRLICAVLEEAARRGLRGLTIAPSSLFGVHAPLAALMQSGVIADVVTDYARGGAADAMMSGALRSLPVLQSHGGRARALTTGQLRVDVAFIGASLARVNGACTGRGGTLACGPLGYAQVDAGYAKRTVVCAHEITQAALPLTDVPSHHVDAVIPFAHPGDAGGIASETTLAAQTAQAASISDLVAQVVVAAGMMRDGMSLQTGAGGYSLACVPVIGQAMATRGITGGFISGGITGAHAALLRGGLFCRIHDVQCFDIAAVASALTNPDHRIMSASEYANPQHPAPVVDRLDVMVLGAVEVDAAFNVNVTIGGDGRLIGGPGGHPDAAAGARLTIVTTGLNGGGYAKLVERVRCVTTQGRDVDVVITDHGIAVNPQRPDVRADLARAGLPVVDFAQLQALAAQSASKAALPNPDTPRLIIEHRRGGALDWA
ncbi:citrate lyase subunit alpha [Sulfitobacter sp. HNIBRBA2951]|uniref:citrate lyase subunit alpha n=1 Tax=Sulfitobacter aquimarinus TaxID=3158557 RepID=UPI0032DF884C